MKHHETSILGISLGTKQTGIAIISYGTLIHWQLHTFHGAWSDTKQCLILKRIERYINTYKIKRLFIKVPPFTHHSIGVESLLKELIARAQMVGCVIDYATKCDIKATVPEIQNAHALMQYITYRYPILMYNHEQAKDQKQPEAVKMFEAVLAAHLMHNRMVFTKK